MGGAPMAGVFHQWHCDHFGHVNTRAYAAAFDDAIFAFWAGLRAPGDGAAIPVTAEMKTAFQAEAGAGTVYEIRAALLRIGGKSVTLQLSLGAAGAEERPLATCEVVEVFFDPETRRSAPIPEGLRARLAAVLPAEAAVIQNI